MNIPELWQKSKNVAEDGVGEWGLIIIVLLVGLASFGLGRLSALEEAKPVVAVYQAPEEKEPRGLYIGGSVVASRNGSVYHFPWCAGAQAMTPQNRVWFASEGAARRAGYTPAKNCKGLQ